MVADNQKRTKSYGQWVATLFTILLLFVLGISTLFTILFGAKIYENINDRMNKNFNKNTALAYVSNKVKQADEENRIEVKNIDGISTLIITEKGEIGVYEDMIYSKDGKLMELYAEQASDMFPDNGMEILELEGVTFSMNNHIIEVSVTEGGETYSMSLYTRSGQDGKEVHGDE